jgi:mevalonate kinase
MIITKAPGKILISGGYGVLQENNYGLALAVNSYFYCVCTCYEPCSIITPFTDITINSFQIDESTRYVNNS